MIKNYLYRKPSFLEKNNIDMLDTIYIHHTANDNSIDINTDYHMNNNAWAWLGYGYYIANGEALKVRGYEYKNAGVLNHNHHGVSIAIQGNYNTKIPSQADLQAVQLCINDIVKNCPKIQFIKGHREDGDTTCPGNLFPIHYLKIKRTNYVTFEEFEKMHNMYSDSLMKLDAEIDKMKEFLSKELNIRIR